MTEGPPSFGTFSTNKHEFHYLYSRKRYAIKLEDDESCICKSLTRKLLITQHGTKVKIYHLQKSWKWLIDSIPLPLDHKIKHITHVCDDYLCGFVTANMPILLVIQISTCKVMIVNLDVKRDCDTSITLEKNEKPEMMKRDVDLENIDVQNGLRMLQVTPDTLLNESDHMKRILYSLLAKDLYDDDDKLIKFTIDGALSPTVMLFTAYRIKYYITIDVKRYKIDLLEISYMTVSNC